VCKNRQNFTKVVPLVEKSQYFDKEFRWVKALLNGALFLGHF
jgi:hypothetical protein